jgi:oxygen-independent coproporphyrinogen-3 oxidase
MNADLVARYDQRVPRYTSYPTAPHFSDAVGPETYRDWLAALPDGAPLSLYLHVPFCAALCLYCGCHTTVVRRYAPVAAYVALLEKEIGMVADALGGRRPVTHIHWGGGTPTILSPADLVSVGNLLGGRFKISDDAEIAVEIDPRTLTRDHVEALAMTGLTRASLGVQDFDQDVQRAINRIQSYDTTARVVDWLRGAGVRGINLDLMYGLPFQTEETVARSVGEALRLDPDRIALFGYAHVPWMKKHQALLPEDRLPNAAERIAQVAAATAVIEAAGYVAIGIDHFAKAGDALAAQQRKGRLKRNFQGYTTDEATALVGLGTSSIGTLPQGYVQNAPSTIAYRDAISAGRFATVRGLALTEEDRLRRSVIERLMCDLFVDLDETARDHGRTISDFAEELARIDSLAKDGIARREGAEVSVPEDARAFVRTVCSVFDRYLSPDGNRHSRAF